MLSWSVSTGPFLGLLLCSPEVLLAEVLLEVYLFPEELFYIFPGFAIEEGDLCL